MQPIGGARAIGRGLATATSICAHGPSAAGQPQGPAAVHQGLATAAGGVSGTASRGRGRPRARRVHRLDLGRVRLEQLARRGTRTRRSNTARDGVWAAMRERTCGRPELRVAA